MRSLQRHELAAQRHRRVVSRELGVSDEEMLALLLLAERGGCTQGEIAAVVGLSRSGTGAMIQRLERAGLVERHPDPNDKRVRLVALAPESRTRIAAAYADLSTGVDQLLRRLAPVERAGVERFLADLAELASRQVHGRDGDIRAPREAQPDWALWG